MSFVRIWVHIVFSTKNRYPFLIKDKRETIYQHIADNCRKHDIFLKAINGYSDHVHCLISLGKQQNMAQVVRLIKGESAYWINNNDILPEKMAWQDDYFAVSVSESQVPKVLAYICNQTRHHTRQTFAEEVEEFLGKYGFQRTDGK